MNSTSINVATAPRSVTMTSTFCRVNSAAFSPTRSGRPSDTDTQSRRCDPRSSQVRANRSANALVHGMFAAALSNRNPMVGDLFGCCARALSRQAVLAQPSRATNSHRLMSSPLNRPRLYSMSQHRLCSVQRGTDLTLMSETGQTLHIHRIRRLPLSPQSQTYRCVALSDAAGQFRK